jgi:hypothetical protein
MYSSVVPTGAEIKTKVYDIVSSRKYTYDSLFNGASGK